jgi:mechanosensitive ion channel-like protein
MQPTLSSVISGLVLDIDYRLRVGDGIISGGEAVEIASIGWRNVVAQKSSGRLMVFPNAKLADAEVEFVPAGRPVRGETLVKLPTPIPPSLAATLISDLPALDPDRVVSVTPSGFDPSAAYTQYHVGYWVSDYRDLTSIENTIQQRLWYGLQRARLYVPSTTPESDAPGDPFAWASPAAIAELVMNCRTDLTPDVARSLAQQGECLLFATGENIALPIRLKGRSFLILRGELAESAALITIEQRGALSRPSVYTLDRAGAERFVAARLARRIGPYAEYALWRAAPDASDIEEFCAAVATEIRDDGERASFLEEVRPMRPQALKPGAIIRAERDVAGSLVPHPRLRAREEVTLLAIPAKLLLDHRGVAG